MAGVLSFAQYVGGPDDVVCEQTFPSNQRTLIYRFNTDVTGWTFTADYQTIVVDQVTFSRSGQPNFSNSQVIGTFAKQEVTGSFAPDVEDTLTGTVKVHFPANMYTGPIVPDARKNVPIVVYSLTWSDANTPPQTMSHRQALVQCWEPDVVAGDPTLETGFVALTLGA